jgi:LacI family transcriptional regulator
MRGATLTLGIEIPDFSNQFFDMVIAGATVALAGSSYQLIIAPAGDPGHEGYGAIQALVDRQVDGVIAFSPLVQPEWLESVARDIPLVMLGRHDESLGYDTVVGDDQAGTALVMAHLIGLGHRDIVHLTAGEIVTDAGSGTPHAIRLDGYRLAMQQAGLGDQLRVARCDNSEEGAYRATVELLAEQVPSAIFAGNDTPALGVLRALAEADLIGRVAVVGYDDTSAASHPLISLTSVDQSGAAMGQRAVEMLLERIGGRADPLHEIFAPALRVRASSGQLRP